MLAVDDVHRIYWEESGRPDGIPALYLHGGPGSGLGPGGYRMKFDPDRFRTVGFDQRGCGRSTPLATGPGYDLTRNTTQHLIADIEALREHRGVDRWLVNGVSWGSTLALAYAQAHPGRVTGLVLTAVTAGSRFEIDWITETVGALYPEAWDRVATHAERAGSAPPTDCTGDRQRIRPTANPRAPAPRSTIGGPGTGQTRCRATVRRR